MTEGLEDQICIKFCIKLEHSFVETIWMIQKAAAMGNCWLAASSQQCAHSCVMSHAEFCGKTANHPGDSAPLQPMFGTLWLLAFPKTKITFEREEISDCQWDSGKFDRTADGNCETVLGPKVPTLKGTEASLSCVQCFLYLVSSSINVSFSHCMAWYFLDRPRLSVPFPSVLLIKPFLHKSIRLLQSYLSVSAEILSSLKIRTMFCLLLNPHLLTVFWPQLNIVLNIYWINILMIIFLQTSSSLQNSAQPNYYIKLSSSLFIKYSEFWKCNSRLREKERC